ncbi:hypothetical protein MPSEU_000471300 [Mayamaea pseudoterrestris]|nr:hypothetical protein MPSEU_000471300 [Mayamaea pseudoterrestris]
MSSNQIIGINGRLPWRIPKDRKAFKTLTENTILIIGRRTYEENPLRRHINHAFATVIMSTSLDANFDDSKLRVARSFSEALHIARLLMEEQSVHADSGRISCWVAGGERVYHEALLHPNAAELHLTTIESEINTLPNQEFAKFPAKYRWDNKFSELSRQEDVDGGLRFTRCIFRRLAGRR